MTPGSPAPRRPDPLLPSRRPGRPILPAGTDHAINLDREAPGATAGSASASLRASSSEPTQKSTSPRFDSSG